MIRTYQHRLETNSTHQYEPVYYVYWGHLQKELLPFMDYSRLSAHSKNLLGLVNRNSWIHFLHFFSGVICGPAKFVISPVDGHTEHLGDKTWLQIISTPPEKMGTHSNNRDNGTNYVEATHWSFASSLGTQAKRQPERFARLSLHFPKDCYEGYISNTNSLDPEHNSAHSLLDNSINCARGCALNAISSLIWEHKELGDFFRKQLYQQVQMKMMPFDLP